MAELVATVSVALLIVLLSARTIGYRGEQWNSGESVSQSPLKDQTFSTFLDQNPPVELRRNCRFHASLGVRKPNVRFPPKSRFPRPKMAGSAARDTVAADGRSRALVVDAAATSPLGYSETVSPEAP